jgi:hypothetical protein
VIKDIILALFVGPSISASSKIVTTNFKVPAAVVSYADVITDETKEREGADTNMWLHRQLKFTRENK